MKKKNIDVLIVSHILNEGQMESGKDFYFGGLDQYLLKNGITAGIVLRDQTGKNIKNISGKWGGEVTPRIIFNGVFEQ